MIVAGVLYIFVGIAFILGLIYWFKRKPSDSTTISTERRPIVSGWGIFLIIFFVLPILNNNQETTPTRTPFHISFDTVEERFEFLQSIEEHLPTADPFLTGTHMPDVWWHSSNTITFVSHHIGWSVLDVMGHIQLGTDAIGRPSVDIYPFTQHTGLMMGVGWREHHTHVNWDTHMITVHTTGTETFAVLPFIFWDSSLSIGGSGVTSSNNIAWLVQVLNMGVLIGLPMYFALRRRTY